MSEKSKPYRVHEGRSPKIMNCSVDEEIFIEMVHMERPLWDKKHRDYKNLEVKNRIWKNIAAKCETTDIECKRRWTGLREKYRREKIFYCKQRRMGMAVNFTQRWKNYLNMMFLDQVYTPRGSYHKSSCSSADQNGVMDAERLRDLEQMNELKYENESTDDENDDEFMNTNLNGSHDFLNDSNVRPNDSSATTSTAQLTSDTTNGARLNPEAIRNAAENFPRIWVNSLPNLSIIPRHIRDEESSSPSPSHHSDQKNQSTSNNHDNNCSNKNLNKYSSFGQYIADTLYEMDERYANELHVHILQEIIKIKSKILKET